MRQGELMILKKKIKMRNFVFLVILCICTIEAIFLPIIANGQINNGNTEFTPETILDLKVRSVILRKKGIFSEIGDAHWFHVALKQDVGYIARIKITAAYGGTFLILLRGVSTLSSYNEIFSSPITNQVLEVVYTADGTTTGDLDILYSTSTPLENPTYTLYFNKTGFAGWWWIALSGIGVLLVLIVNFTFMVIGMTSIAKRKKGTKRKKKRK